MSALYCELKFHCDLLSYVEPLILLNFCLIPAGTVTLAILNDKKLPNGIEIESDGVNQLVVFGLAFIKSTLFDPV